MMDKPLETRLSVLVKNLPHDRRAALIEQLGCSRQTLCRWYKQPSKVPYKNLVQITDFLNVEYERSYLIPELIEPIAV